MYRQILRACRVRSLLLLLAVLQSCPPVFGAEAPVQSSGSGTSVAKQAAVASVDRHARELATLSDQVWGFAETALKEHRSSKALADYAARRGFTVERGVAGMPTAFVASYGKGRPIIGILGEFDALPGISQRATPEQSPLVAGAAGHGCGHNLFGAGSLGAALAIQEQIAAGTLAGTVRFYGTPAEEAIGGKLYMARAGLFNDLDAVFTWHPGDRTFVNATYICRPRAPPH